VGKNKDILPRDWERIIKYTLAWFSANRNTILGLKAANIPENLAIDFDAINLSVRTSNCLRRQGLHKNPELLKSMTFRDLLKIPGMGDRSVLDFSVMLEDWAAELTSTEKESVNMEKAIGLLIETSNEPWASLISQEDPRFTNLFPPGRGSLSDIIEDVVSNSDDVGISKLVNNISRIKQRISDIDSMPLEQCLLDLLNSFPKLSEERSKVLSYRFGFQGKAPETLASVGDRIGVTRERVRQIEKRIYERLPKSPIYMPQLEKAISILEDMAPLSVDDSMQQLINEGLTNINFHPKSIIAPGKFCRIDMSLKVQSIRKQALVTAKTEEKVARRLLTLAIRIAGASGATDIEEVLDQAQIEKLDFEQERAIRLLKNSKEIVWLDDNWFWVPSIPTARNRLRNVTRRMLSVAAPIHIKKLRAGARRMARFRNSSNNRNIRIPPISIMRVLFESHPEFIIDEKGYVSSLEALDYQQELGEGERILVDIIRSTPTSLLDRHALRKESVKRGTNPNTFEMLLTYSPIIEHVDVNIWTLRGLVVDPTQVEAIRVANALKPTEKRVTSFGWTEEGHISIKVRVPEIPPPSFVFLAPAGVNRFVCAKEYNIINPQEVQDRSIKVLEAGNVLGSGEILRRLGADEGDVANFIFDYVNKTVAVDIDSEENMVND
jgi:hypothetical protein